VGWIGALFARLSGEEPPVAPVDHPVFGRIQPSHRPRNGAWLWETLTPLDHPRGPVTVTWLADRDGPSDAQVAFWTWLSAHIDDVLAQAWPLLSVDVAEWTERPPPDDPWDELFWEGAGLPADGRRDSDWDVSFATRTCPDVMLTVYFEHGEPAVVVADD
jgi:hypothetical protein